MDSQYTTGFDNAAISRIAYKLAEGVAKETEKYSRMADPVREAQLPRFCRDEVVLGDLLGVGGFNQVLEVYCLDLQDNPDHDFSDQMQLERHHMSQENTRERYAIKFLREETREDQEEYFNGAADLMVESKILSWMRPHPNVIQLHGLSAGGARGFASGVEGGFFLILDRLNETLVNRCDKWRETEARLSLVDGKKRRLGFDNAPRYEDSQLGLGELFLEQLKVAFDISSAIRHVHRHNVVFRDLKPDNIGFDKFGVVKLFDFGLAKELTSNLQNEDDTYELSGQTGSRRYMSPEVGLNEPYNLSADVYGFGLIFWNICALQEPFDGMNRKDHLERVMVEGERPELNTSWPAAVRNVMACCWKADPTMRPRMKDVYIALKKEVYRYEKALTLPTNASFEYRRFSTGKFLHLEVKNALTDKVMPPARRFSSTTTLEISKKTKDIVDVNIPVEGSANEKPPVFPMSQRLTNLLGRIRKDP